MRIEHRSIWRRPDPTNAITAGPLNEIFGVIGETNNGMVKFTIGRPAKMHGATIDTTMGVNTWAAFAGTDDNAVVTAISP
jgi:hypothetical protein